MTTPKPKEKLPPGQKWAGIKPQHWYEWGSESNGKVSTFAYDDNGEYHFTGYMDKGFAQHNLTFHNPHS